MQGALTNKPGRGVLFRKQVNQGENRPNFTGGLNIDGVEYELAVWERRSKNGKPYLSLNVKRSQQSHPRAEGDGDGFTESSF